VRPGISLGQQSRRDLLWIRDEFLQSSMDFGRVVIHGHTPVRDVSFRANRINIDTGAYATGVLSCVILGAETTEVLTISKTAQ
jgi:serine/threonine protein phosphatase 1